ncbi:MAG: UDP-glucose 4-epimerase, partial [uncultured Thermomicrobiales bacterium]
DRTPTETARPDHRRRRHHRHRDPPPPRRPLRPPRAHPDAPGFPQPRRRRRRPGRHPARLRGGGRRRPPRRLAGRRDAVGGHPAQQSDRDLQRVRGRPPVRRRGRRLRLVEPRDRDVRTRRRAEHLRAGRSARLRPHRARAPGFPLRRLQGLRRSPRPLLRRLPRPARLLPPHRRRPRRRRPDRPGRPRLFPRPAGPARRRDPPPADARRLALPARLRPTRVPLPGGRPRRLRHRLRRLEQPPPLLGHRTRQGVAGVRARGRGARV